MSQNEDNHSQEFDLTLQIHIVYINLGQCSIHVAFQTEFLKPLTKLIIKKEDMIFISQHYKQFSKQKVTKTEILVSG